MSETDRQVIERRLPFLSGKISLLSLQAFDTEQQFSYQIRLNIQYLVVFSSHKLDLLLLFCFYLPFIVLLYKGRARRYNSDD